MPGYIKLEIEPTRLPAGFVTSAECAKRLGMADNQLRTMRARPAGQDRGPKWYLAANGWTTLYNVNDIAAYLERKAAVHDVKSAELRERAKAVRTVEPEERPGFMARTEPRSGHVEAGATHGAGAETQAQKVRTIQRANRLGDLKPAVDDEAARLAAEAEALR